MPMAFILGAFGCLCLALGIDRHWRDLLGTRPHGRRERVRLRLCGALLLCGSLALRLDEPPVSLGVLLWTLEVMTTAGLVAAGLALHAVFRRGGRAKEAGPLTDD